MDSTINDILIEIDQIRVSLIQAYQADSLGQSRQAIDLLLDINSNLINANIKLVDITNKLMAKEVERQPRLRVV